MFPGSPGLIKASGPGNSIACPILDDTGLFMEESGSGNRLTEFIARNGDLHFEEFVFHHPCEQFQCVCRVGIYRIKGEFRQLLFDNIAKLLSFHHCLYFFLIQSATYYESHVAFITD